MLPPCDESALSSEPDAPWRPGSVTSGWTLTICACAVRLANAMTAHPEMVSGEHRSDLALMQAGRGDWVTKIGAEGVQAVGIRSQGLGIAIKVADGQKRGLYPAIVAVLDALRLLDPAARTALAPWAKRTVRNYRGIETGEVHPVVALAPFAARLSSLPPG